MSEPKTVRNDASVEDFINAVENPRRRDDAGKLLKLMREITGEPPEMWGSSIVGFGSYRYRYASGREGDWPITGFSPRKQNLVVYAMPGFSGVTELLARLGKHRTGKSCLYLNRLDDVDLDVLAELIRKSVAEMRSR